MLKLQNGFYLEKRLQNSCLLKSFNLQIEEKAQNILIPGAMLQNSTEKVCFIIDTESACFPPLYFLELPINENVSTHFQQRKENMNI